MKRRLSLAMSICNNPKVIFIDEPTTGMDPGNRRHIWETILKIRKGRLVVLTTHSMEEADVLGDKIAIMSKGRLKCVGNSLHLKTKYGSGYRLSLVTTDHQSQRVIEIMNELLPEASLQTSNAGYLVFSLDTHDLDKSAQAFAALRTATYEDAGSQMELPLINDWGIANTTLEDVFIQTTRTFP
jgi:ABC-type multidrug transport system ATPase subunit